MSTQRNRKSKPPYQCIRCDYTTIEKTNMRRHLYSLNKQCQAIRNDIELTEEIKDKIMDNRIYHIPKPIKNINNDAKRNKTELSKLNNNEYYNYIYLLRPEESVLSNNNIYKIGMSVVKEKSCNITRLLSYRIGSELVYVCQCIDANKMENEILKIFNNEFKRAYGNEYFIGNKFKMIKIINSILETEEKSNEEDNLTDNVDSIDNKENIVILNEEI